ncbi:hypothetical protein KAR91_47055 [Candidatus Pacearchaeota archaeon]|nr:hypothetical protein [Candidatus Pacearchaeota archaeon]
MRCFHIFKGICKHTGEKCTFPGDIVIHCGKYKQYSCSMCSRDAKLSGLCAKHYDSERKKGKIGDPDLDLMMFGPPEDRWWDELKETDNAS